MNECVKAHLIITREAATAQGIAADFRPPFESENRPGGKIQLFERRPEEPLELLPEEEPDEDFPELPLDPELRFPELPDGFETWPLEPRDEGGGEYERPLDPELFLEFLETDSLLRLRFAGWEGALSPSVLRPPP